MPVHSVELGHLVLLNITIQDAGEHENLPRSLDVALTYPY